MGYVLHEYLLYFKDEHTCAENEVTSILLCYVWEWVAEWKWREKEAEGEKEKEKETVLSYDERLDWLESDDCSKWPGRWLYLCFPFSPSLIPSSLTHLLPHLHLSPSMSVFVTPFPWFHHGSPSTECLSLLMAQLLALMHFKRTAAATSQSDGKYTSSCNLYSLHPFFHPISWLCSNVLHFESTLLPLSDSGHHQQSLWWWEMSGLTTNWS